jgi:hypothetical protein
VCETVADDPISGLSVAGPLLAEIPRAELETEAMLASTPPAPDRPKPEPPPISARCEIPLDRVARQPLPRFQASESKSSSSASTQPLVRDSLVLASPNQSGEEMTESMLQARAIHKYKAATEPSFPHTQTNRSLADDHGRSQRRTTSRVGSSNLPLNYFSTPSRSIVEPRLTPRSTEARRGAVSARSKTTETIIQVTIGRIEVRATPQQPSVPRKCSTSPVMSLDEYLRSREKRGGE